MITKYKAVKSKKTEGHIIGKRETQIDQDIECELDKELEMRRL